MLFCILRYYTNTNKNSHSAKSINKNDTEVLGGQLGGKQVCFECGSK